MQLAQADHQNQDFNKLFYDNRQLIMEEFTFSFIEIADYLKLKTRSDSKIAINEAESNCYLIDNSLAIKLGYKAPTVQEALSYYATESGWGQLASRG